MKRKVKRKTRTHTKKVTRVPRTGKAKKTRTRAREARTSSKTKRGKKPQYKRKAKKQSKKQLVTVTNPSVKQLQKQVRQLQSELKQSKRAEAAKKGWATRRAKIAEKQAVRLDAEVHRAIIPPIVLTGESAEELIEREAHLREPHVQRQIQARLIEKMPEFFVQGVEYLQQTEPRIMFRLIIAEQEGDFYDVVKELADEYDYDTHSIYELWNGYTLDS